MRRTIPVFNNEADEADWWYRNRKELEGEFIAAAERGELGRLNRQKLEERLRSGKTTVDTEPETSS